MRKNYRKAVVQPKRQYRINEAITVPEVRLIDEHDTHIGVVSTQEARAQARGMELDLVEIQPQANPPVCKIIDFGKLKYSEEKELRKQKAKQKKTEVKGIRLSLRIGQHDIAVRLAQAKKFLEQNDKVRVELGLRGRERQHGALARKIIEDFVKAIEQEHGIPTYVEAPISMQGGRLSVIIGKKT
jgi:translation initiation factor IF-3